MDTKRTSTTPNQPATAPASAPASADTGGVFGWVVGAFFVAATVFFAAWMAGLFSDTSPSVPCTAKDTPVGCDNACTAVDEPYAGCTPQPCTAVDNPYAGCTATPPPPPPPIPPTPPTPPSGSTTPPAPTTPPPPPRPPPPPPPPSGCTDRAATNYDSAAVVDDNSCIVGIPCDDQEGYFPPDSNIYMPTAPATPAGCTPQACTTNRSAPYSGCDNACTAANPLAPYDGCTPQACTAEDTPYVGCDNDCTAVGVPYPGCDPPICTAENIPYAGCDNACSAVDTPYEGCDPQQCTDTSGVLPYPGCIRLTEFEVVENIAAEIAACDGDVDCESRVGRRGYNSGTFGGPQGVGAQACADAYTETWAENAHEVCCPTPGGCDAREIHDGIVDKCTEQCRNVWLPFQQKCSEWIKTANIGDIAEITPKCLKKEYGTYSPPGGGPHSRCDDDDIARYYSQFPAACCGQNNANCPSLSPAWGEAGGTQEGQASAQQMWKDNTAPSIPAGVRTSYDGSTNAVNRRPTPPFAETIPMDGDGQSLCDQSCAILVQNFNSECGPRIAEDNQSDTVNDFLAVCQGL